MKLIIISGVSGSGKSTALNVLEDLDYYCIDNLPVGLLPAFAEQMNAVSSELVENIAVGIDARNLPAELHRFAYILDQLKNKGIVCEILFLSAGDDVLIKRFSETRRKHPLTIAELTLPDAIKKERNLLEPIASKADLYIDTSHTNLHQLRDLVRERVQSQAQYAMSLMFESFGFKHGIPTDADFVYDVRCLPNPHWEPKLRSQTGLDKEVAQFLEAKDIVKDMFIDIENFLTTWIPRFEEENRSYMTVAIGCTGGQHRSVYFANRLSESFRQRGKNVTLRHRDLA